MPSQLSGIFPSDHSKVLCGVAVGVGLATAASMGYNMYKKKKDNSPPKMWKEVGELTELICYPIKSCGPVRVTESECTPLGLKDGFMRDRIFMIITPEGQFITARSHPKCVQIMPRFEGDNMILSAPGLPDISINVKKLYEKQPEKALVWGQSVDAVNCGDDVAKWLSNFLVNEDIGMRLVFYPQTYTTRDVREKNKIFSTLDKSDSGALHDATSFMLMTEASLGDLNTKLDHNVGALQFRPNFMVKGPLKPYEEDNWTWIRIGKDTTFKYCKPCTRCIFTNIDPDSAKRHPEGEPLKTLKTYRKFEKTGESPVMGVHIGLRGNGSVKIGDSVFIGMS